MSDPAAPAPGREAAVVEVERQVAVLVQRMRLRWRELARGVHPELQPIGYKILVTLATGGPAPANRLVTALATDKSTLSRQVGQLERLGLIERRVDPDDGRVRLLALTPGAASRLAEVRASSLAEMRSELGSWPVEDLDALGGLLGRLAAAIRPGEPAEPTASPDGTLA